MEQAPLCLFCKPEICTHDSVAKLHFVGMAGSLRKGSFSRAALCGLQDNLRADARLDLCNLQLPLYNEDEDGVAAPDDVRIFRSSIAASDGVVIVTPEYNHGIPGVLKNALDWASRPFGESALINKPVLVMSISPAFTGGVRAQVQLHETLLAIQAQIVPGPQIVIGGAADKVKEGVLVDRSCLDFVQPGLDRLIAMSRALTDRNH